MPVSQTIQKERKFQNKGEREREQQPELICCASELLLILTGNTECQVTGKQRKVSQ